MKNKGQEEMVGFVLIVVIVAIIGIILLGITLMKDTTQTSDSQDISNFLSAVSYYTSDCELAGRKLDIGELVTKCSEDKTCDDGEVVCDYIENLLEEIIEKSTYNTREGSRVLYYDLRVYWEDLDNLIEPVQSSAQGTSIGVCPTIKRANNKKFNTVSGERIIMNFEVCYSDS